VEKRLGTEMPNAYREFQLNYPEQLIESKFNNEYFTNDSSYLIEMNESFRGGGLPKDYLVIGNDIGGNYFFININGSDSSVYYLDHEEASENGKSSWEEMLKVNNKDLNEFSDWLVEHWGEAL
jgi:hypothetical protein